MQNFTLYNSGTTIQVQADTAGSLKHILKMCSHAASHRIFLLNERNDLYTGLVEPLRNLCPVSLLRSAVVDVECSQGKLYIVDQSGSVYRIDADELSSEEWTEIVVPNPKTCPHGVKSTSEKVRIAKINCNLDGLLFTTIGNELFAQGHFGDVLRSEEPVPVECFAGFTILQVSTGDHFVVVLTFKKPHTGHAEDDYSEEGSDSSPVYLNTECSRCAPDTITPVRPRNLLPASTTETSMASSGSQSDVFELDDMWQNGAAAIASETGCMVDKVLSEPLKSHKEVALNFLLESLSISSEDAGKQTKLIKDNVSNITSMVCEGVRTLSRHMSGSDGNDPSDSEVSIEDVLDKSLKTTDVSDCADSLAEESSLGIGSAIDLQSECELENKIAKICRIGAGMLGTGVWCFGNVNKGHLGTGDHIMRTRINSVLGLTGQGVVKIASGREHSIAITLDGRLYLWGTNGYQQISTEEIEDVTSPRRYRNAHNTLDATCGGHSTVILLNNLQVKEFRLRFDEEKPKTFNPVHAIDATMQRKFPLCLATVDDYFLQNHSKVAVEIERHLTGEQRFLQEALQSYITIIKPFLKKLYFVNGSQTVDHLCQQYLNLINISTVNLKSMADYFNGTINCQDILLLQNITEMISAYRTYTRCFCDVTAQQGFHTINLMLDKTKDGQRVFAQPFRRVWAYVDFICDLLAIETTEVYQTFLAERRTAWEKFKIEKDLAIELATKTTQFWEGNGKSLIQKLQIAERRLILDSKEVPLKLLPSGRFSTHWLLLFNDIFCHHSNNTLQTYPLKTVWVSSIIDTESRRNAFKVVTPEDSYVLVARQHEDKAKWLEAFEAGIKVSLEKPTAAKVPQYRNASYTFSEKHARYPGVKYFGRWYVGQMQGIGHLEFTDGKAFNGQMSNGEINGFGRMFTPNVGIYAGDFVSGRYHGFGQLEMKSHGSYEGNFKDGLFNGHGILRTDQYTYIGEFVSNQKSGYGVLDDSISGDKYMGMFVDGKRCGFGVSITMDGNYFEGIFGGDVLAGEGVAVFENGSYYEGELVATGPNGKGTLFLPRVEVKNEAIELEERNIEMSGNILTGTLTGSWADIKISHGNITMSQSFAKVPRSLGLHATDYNRKWRSLFQDWEYDVFGGAQADLDHKQIWNKIAIFITNAKRKEQLKSDSLPRRDNTAQWNGSTVADMVLSNNENNSSLTLAADRISMKSNSQQSLSSQYSKKGMHQLHTKIHEFIEEANKFNDNIAASRSISCQLLSHRSNEMLYDNLKNEASNLTEIFKNKRDVAEKILNAAALEYSNSAGCGAGGDVKKARGQSKALTVPVSSTLDFIPRFGSDTLDQQNLALMKSYLSDAFKDPNHPFGVLNSKISFCFYTSYGCWKVKPTSILSVQAMREWEVISKRIYGIVRRMFPSLPLEMDNIDGEIVSHRSLLYPILLSERVYSTLFVLYASKCSQNDELYRQRVLVCDKKTDAELTTFLRIESNLLPMIQSSQFESAIACLKQVKEKYCPREMLAQIENTFKLLDQAKNETLGNNRNTLNADNIMPLTIFLILRAGIPHLGAEILLLEDLLGNDFEPAMTGFSGYCFVTVKATYQHLLSSKFFQD